MNLEKINLEKRKESDTTKIYPLRATKQKENKKEIYGFDIETYNNNKEFYCASIYSEKKDHSRIFFSKDDVIRYFKKKRFWNSIISATNLQFDFLGIFHKKEDIQKFSFLFRGSDLLMTRTFIHNHKFMDRKEFKKEAKSKQGKAILFLDTLNYAKMSVEGLGKLLKIPKLKKPDFLGEKPKTLNEKNELINYNMRDAEISKKAIDFFYNNFSQLGATPKMTIASSSMSLFRNKYLEGSYYRHEEPILMEQFQGYYGGRCEVFQRGKVDNYNVYDINSLYPSVMIKEFPNPNSLRVTKKNTVFYIENYEGVSCVDVSIDNIDYPFLPFKTGKKLIFPIGSFTGWYSHVELRKAMDLGYTITKVRKTYYYKETFYPFKNFILELYELRNKYKKEKNPMQITIKLLMNSLYGKFAQKFTDRDSWRPCSSMTANEIMNCKFIERVGDFFRIKKEDEHPQLFCFPIWSLYVTSYGRIKLYDSIKKYDAVYVDTDSIFTRKEMSDSDRLGEFKYEYTIKKGCVVKPKFYGLIKHNGEEKVCIKGIGKRLTYDEFNNIVKNPIVQYKKFVKFKESMRRNFIPNEIIDIMKELSLDDDKRIWKIPFDSNTLCPSSPQKIERYINPSIYPSIIKNVSL